ncbi:MAG: branched chain amino acid ABC transporter periplasmic ligand-binding protein [uncultured bacterium]|uniref:Leucine-binding protein domain-containing protein n=1 Tax=Candidatus Wolfebacteria bacterium GW2011_GWE2_44_13 TaxID=1619017 RepID=A0A0G1H8S8_9BACT|nr:MAG: branched chain amino acid ABC transporter periplasmic ligand-binding protein [uncultured bacterium]KKT43190.1 MAG: hypothetical protein UW32_C0002G0051 [Candidatus Wolfebacteria bacterium GW2011_GWE2_44_13]
MNNKKLVIALMAIVVVGIAGTYFFKGNGAATENEAGDVINIGAILSLTSYGASDGESIKNGLELARKDLIKENIIVNIDYFDDGTDPKQVVSGVQYMKSKNIDIVFGPIWSYLGDAALAVVGGSNITLLAPSLTSEVVQQASSQIVFGQAKNAEKLPATTAWMQENNIKKPAIIVNQIAWGNVHATMFAEAVKNAGGIVVLNEEIGFGKEKETLPGLIVKAKFLGADAILWAGSNDGEVIIISEMQKLGMKMPLFADEGVMTAFNSGLISKDITVPVYTWNKAMHPEFVAKFKAEYNKEPDHYADAAYDMLIAAAKTVSKNGTSNLKANLNSLNYTGYAGTYQFDEKGDIKGGDWKVVKITK